MPALRSSSPEDNNSNLLSPPSSCNSSNNSSGGGSSSSSSSLTRKRKLVVSILNKTRGDLPSYVEDVIDTIVEDAVKEIRSSVHDLLCRFDAGDYRGLVAGQDTPDQVENAVRLFPEVLLTTAGIVEDADEDADEGSHRQEHRDDDDDHHPHYGDGEDTSDEEEDDDDDDDYYYGSYRNNYTNNTNNHYHNTHNGTSFRATTTPQREYPIQIQTTTTTTAAVDDFHTSVKAATFVPLLSRLAIELDLFPRHLRGGLLVEDENGNNVFRRLVSSAGSGDTGHHRLGPEEHESTDRHYAGVLRELHESNLLTRDDVRRHDLLHKLCFDNKDDRSFPGRRFAVLCGIDPWALAVGDSVGKTPLHKAAAAVAGGLRSFRKVFEEGLFRLPTKNAICLLFKKDVWGQTPFSVAAKHHGTSATLSYIEEILGNHHHSNHRTNTTSRPKNDATVFRSSADSVATTSNSSLSLSSSSSSSAPKRLSRPVFLGSSHIEAFLMAVRDDSISMDCVYFLIRRNPHTMIKMLSGMMKGKKNEKTNLGNGTTTTAAAAATSITTISTTKTTLSTTTSMEPRGNNNSNRRRATGRGSSTKRPDSPDRHEKIALPKKQRRT